MYLKIHQMPPSHKLNKRLNFLEIKKMISIPPNSLCQKAN
jgi:hypothetical protein